MVIKNAEVLFFIFLFFSEFYIRPFLIGYNNEMRLVFFPHLLYLFVIVEIQLVIYYRPCIWLCRRLMALGSSVSAKPAVLRSVFFRHIHKSITVFLAFE